MRKAVPVRIPEWPDSDFPTSKQLQTYILFWEHKRKPLEPDPGAGLYQKSFWLDPENLDLNAYEAECFRGERPDRAQFIRRTIASITNEHQLRLLFLRLSQHRGKSPR